MKGKGKHIGARGSLSSFLARHITALTSLRGRRTEGKRKVKHLSARERNRLAFSLFINSRALFPIFLPLQMSTKLAMLKHSEVNKNSHFYTLEALERFHLVKNKNLKEHQNRVSV